MQNYIVAQHHLLHGIRRTSEMKMVIIPVIIAFSLGLYACDSTEVYDIRNYGAVGDGIWIDSPAINEAILDAANDGGGTVMIPEGIYSCHSIRLASNVNLVLEEGAVIKAAPHTIGQGYDAPEANPYDSYQDFGHSHWCNSLIYGIGLKNISISGKGMIDGENLSDGFTFSKRATNIDCDFSLEDGVGNKSIAFKECKNVTIRDITIRKGGHFCLLATGVDSLTIEGITVDTNRDGLDIDCCSHVVIKGCSVNSYRDDAIVMKSSFALGRYKACEDIVISDCAISGYLVGSLLDGTKKHLEDSNMTNHATRSSGRIKLGTESTCDFRNISVNNCKLDYCGGLHVESTDGAVIDNISFSDITIDRCSDSPIFVMIGARLRSPEGRELGSISNVSFKNITSTNARADYGSIITGYHHRKIKGITLENVSLHSMGGILQIPSLPVPELEKQYPDPKSFGRMPSSGLYLRHIDGITLRNVRTSCETPDARENILASDCSNLLTYNE